MVIHAHLADVHYLWRPGLRDPDDDLVLECAVASASQYIVTHNLRHFGETMQFNVKAITPAQFLAKLMEET